MLCLKKFNLYLWSAGVLIFPFRRVDEFFMNENYTVFSFLQVSHGRLKNDDLEAEKYKNRTFFHEWKISCLLALLNGCLLCYFFKFNEWMEHVLPFIGLLSVCCFLFSGWLEFTLLLLVVIGNIQINVDINLFLTRL